MPRPVVPDVESVPVDVTAISGRSPILVVLLLAIGGAAMGFQKVWDKDIFWHLACGDWMIEHGRLLGHDPFSIPEADGSSGRWVNVHWLFQVAVSGLHALGGFRLLSIVTAFLAGLLLAGWSWGFGRRARPAWLLVVGLTLLLGIITRVRLRPELPSMLWLVLVILILEQIRHGGSPKVAWWLVPIHVVWVNMHGLWFLGPLLCWTAIAGSWAEGRLGRPGGGALARRQVVAASAGATCAFLLMPWPSEVLTHAFLLSSRLRLPEYRTVVGEFTPTWENLDRPAAWPFLLLLSAAWLSLLLARRRGSLVHLGWLALFTFLGLSAWRNMPIASLVAGSVLAVTGEGLLARRFASKSRGRSARTILVFLTLCALGLTGGIVTGGVRFLLRDGVRFGWGLAPNVALPRIADFLRSSPVPGDVLTTNFADAGYLERRLAEGRDRPARLFWTDARLESHTRLRHVEHYEILTRLASPATASEALAGRRSGDATSVRFVVVGAGMTPILTALSESSAYRLACLDSTAACFVRVDPDRPLEGLPAVNWNDLDLPLRREGVVLSQAASWRVLNPDATDALTGRMCLGLSAVSGSPVERGDGDAATPAVLLAIRYLSAATMQPTGTSQERLLLAHSCRQRGAQWHPTALPIDVNSSRELRLLDGIGPGELPDGPFRMSFLLEVAESRLKAGLVDAALEPLERARALARNDSPVPLLDRMAFLEQGCRRLIEDGERSFEAQAALPIPDRARWLVSRGLVLRAQRLLEGDAPGNPEVPRLLGDLSLRQGLSDRARSSYARLEPSGDRDLMIALCDWVEGDLFAARAKLERLRGLPAAEAYAGELSRQLGNDGDASSGPRDPRAP